MSLPHQIVISDLEPHVQRMVIELRGLNDRRTSLSMFILGNDTYAELPLEEKLDLADQLRAMDSYATILSRRLVRHCPALANVKGFNLV